MRLLSRGALSLLALDVALGLAAWWGAFWLRFNFDVPPEFEEVLLRTLPWAVCIHAAAFWALGLYRGLWRFASLPDLKRILIAVGIATLAVPALFGMARIGFPVPRTV